MSEHGGGEECGQEWKDSYSAQAKKGEQVRNITDAAELGPRYQSAALNTDILRAIKAWEFNFHVTAT